MNITANNKKTTKTAGRPAIEGRRRQYVIAFFQLMPLEK